LIEERVEFFFLFLVQQKEHEADLMGSTTSLFYFLGFTGLILMKLCLKMKKNIGKKMED